MSRGVNRAKDRRPALDELLRDAKRRRFDVLVCWRLDRLGRNLRHLILLLYELQELRVGLATVAHLSLNAAAVSLSVSRSTVERWCRSQSQPAA